MLVAKHQYVKACTQFTMMLVVICMPYLTTAMRGRQTERVGALNNHKQTPKGNMRVIAADA